MPDITHISDLIPDAKNANRGTDRGRAMLSASLKTHGAGRSILLDRKGRIIAGNKTAQAAGEAGLEDVVVVQTDGRQVVAVQRMDLDLEDGTAARELAYADNRVGQVDLEWDADQLLKDVGEGLDLSALWTDEELKELTADAVGNGAGGEDPGAQVDRAEELRVKWGVERGQVWEIESKATPGKAHRVMCGDSTEAEDVERLMGGERAGLCFTSPPYAQQREYSETVKAAVADWDGLMRGVFGNLPMADAGQILVNLGLVHKGGEWQSYWDGWIAWMRDQGWRRFGWYVWDQGPGMPGDWGGRLAPSFEFVFHFNHQGVKPVKARDCAHAGKTHGGKGQRGADGVVKPRHAGTSPVQETAILDSVIRVNRQGASHDAGGHPAPYPVGLPAAALASWPGIVVDPFLGSGTTLIAAEQTGRICAGMEVEPGYVAVCLERASGLGLSPVLACGPSVADPAPALVST